MKSTHILIGIITIGLCTSCYKEDNFIETAPIFNITKDNLISVEDNTPSFTVAIQLLSVPWLRTNKLPLKGKKLLLKTIMAKENQRKYFIDRLFLKHQILVV